MEIKKEYPSYVKDVFTSEAHSLLDLINKLHDDHQKKLISVDRYNGSGGILEFKVTLDEVTTPIIEELIDIDLYNKEFIDYSHEPDAGTIDLSMLINDHETIFGNSHEIVWYENENDDSDCQYTFSSLKRSWEETDEMMGDDENWGSSDWDDEDEDY